MKQIEIGDTLSQTFTINETQTAKYLGSGNLDVFATPAMIACMENTALKLIQKYLEPGFDTVGTEICTKHLKASKIGSIISFEAKVTIVEGRKIEFDITALNQNGECIGTAKHQRYIIDIQQFINKVQ